MSISGSESTKGLSVSILENKELGNCSNNGLSSRCKSVIIVSDHFKIDEVFDVTDEQPSVVIIARPRFDDVIAVPKSILDNKENYMFGGCFLYSSDSRFSELNNGSPIKLFDRVEN